MRRADTFDVAIAGAGPAALVLGIVLAESGRRVVLLGSDGRSAPQERHVHIFANDLWPALLSLVPKLEWLLRDRAIPLLSPTAEVRHSRASAAPPLPVSRALLDESLREAAIASSLDLRRERFNAARHDGRSWRVEATAGTHLQASWLIDATGTARKTVRSVVRTLGSSLPLDEAAGAFSYASWRFAGPFPDSLEAFQRSWSAQFRTGVVVAPDGDSWMLTIQSLVPIVEHLPDSPAGLLDAMGHTQLACICAGADPVGTPGRWTGTPISRIDLGAATLTGLPWLAVGDALVTTPPILGWGYQQIVEHGSAFHVIPATDEPGSARKPLIEASMNRFKQAIFATARRSGSLLGERVASSLPRFSGKNHVELSEQSLH